MIFLKRDIDGSFIKCGPDENATHVYMSARDYSNLQDDILHFRGKTEIALGNASRINENTENVKKKLKETKSEIEGMQNQNDELLNSIMSMDDEVITLENSNRNLRRIVRERSNSARNLRPKKEHSGYVPLRVDQMQVTAGYSEESGPIRAMVWKTTFETPYPALICFEDIEEEVMKELKETVLSECDVIFLQCDLSEVPEYYSEDNVIYFHDAHYNQKDKSGLWNICLYSTQQIDLSQIK